jgi:hypothetical protein
VLVDGGGGGGGAGDDGDGLAASLDEADVDGQDAPNRGRLGRRY